MAFKPSHSMLSLSLSVKPLFKRTIILNFPSTDNLYFRSVILTSIQNLRVRLDWGRARKRWRGCLRTKLA